MFLTLVGLTALGVGGVGASEAVSAFLDRKRFDIAILKSLGADGRLVFLDFLPADDGHRPGGAAAGGRGRRRRRLSLSPWFFKDSLPLPPALGIYPLPLLQAAAFGLLSAIAFAVPPLGRARAIPPASLLREIVAPKAARCRRHHLITAGARRL